MPNLNGWTRVSDALPSEEGTYLTISISFQYEIEMFEAGQLVPAYEDIGAAPFDGMKFYSLGSAGEHLPDDTVTYWREFPLPRRSDEL